MCNKRREKDTSESVPETDFGNKIDSELSGKKHLPHTSDTRCNITYWKHTAGHEKRPPFLMASLLENFLVGRVLGKFIGSYQVGSIGITRIAIRNLPPLTE